MKTAREQLKQYACSDRCLVVLECLATKTVYLKRVYEIKYEDKGSGSMVGLGSDHYVIRGVFSETAIITQFKAINPIEAGPE